MFNQLDDLDFADNIALLFHSHQQMQEKFTQVERRAAGFCELTFMYNFALHTCVGVSNNGYKFLRYTVMSHQLT
jgi:hypothetical protein